MDETLKAELLELYGQLGTEGADDEAIRKRLKEIQKATKTGEAGRATAGQSAFRGLTENLSFGLQDEILGGASAVGAMLPGGQAPGEAYTARRDEARANRERLQQAHPAAYGVGSVAGALLPSLVPMGLAATAGRAGQGARQAVNAGRLALRPSTVGGAAAYGGAQGALGAFGASEGETAGEIIGDTARGLALGAGLGGGGEALARGARTAWRASPLSAGQAGAIANRAVQENLTDAGFANAEQVYEATRGQGQMIGNLSPALIDKTVGYSSRTDRARDAAVEAVTTRQDRAAEEMLEAQRRLSGLRGIDETRPGQAGRLASEERGKLAAARKEAADREYGGVRKAANEAGEVEIDDNLRQLLNYRGMRSFVNEAADMCPTAAITVEP